MKSYLAAIHLFSHDLRRLMLSNALHGFVFFGIYALLLNLYLLRLGYGPAYIGLTNAVGPLALAVASLPVGQLSRRFGSRRVLIIGYFFSAAFLTLLPLGEGLPGPWPQRWIVLTYGISWLFGAFIVVNLSPFVMGSTTSAERNYAFSVQSALFPVAGFVGNLVGGLLPGLLALLLGMTLDEAAPYRYSLIMAGVLDFLASLTMLQTQEVHVEPTGQVEPTGSPNGRARETKRSSMPVMLIGIISLVWLLRLGSEWTMRIFFNVYLDTALGTPTALIGVLLASGQLLGMAALFAPFAIMRFGKVRTIIWATVGMALAFMPLIVIAHWLAVGSGFVALMALASLSVPAYSLFSQESVAPAWRTTMASSMSMALGIGVAAVAFGGGYVILAFGYPTLFAAGALLALLAALIFGLYFRVPRGEAALSAVQRNSLQTDE